MSGIHSKQKGFTLIEIIMVMVLLGIIGVIVFQVVASGVENFMKAKDRKELYDQGRLALERMVREIRVASEITYPSAGNSDTYINFTKATYGYATGAPFDTSTTLTYQLNGTNLERVGDISGTTVLATDVSAFTVTHEIGDFVSLELSINSSTVGTVSMRTKVYPRNLP